MQLIALLILALSTTAFSYPSTNATLTPHASRGWIGAFDKEDTGCANPDGQDGTNGARPELLPGQCVPFNPQTDRIGLDWGAGRYRFSTLTAYENDDCTVVQATIENTPDTAGDCFWLSNLGGGEGGEVISPCFWLSVRAG